LREACEAVACVNHLLVAGRAARREAFLSRLPELRSLASLINSEFDRRLQAVKATVAAIQSF
jgi:hypothetical protein